MAKVELKQPIVDEIINNVKDAESVVLVNYSGLTVEQDTALRKELREAGVVYKVYKNTMMHRCIRRYSVRRTYPALTWNKRYSNLCYRRNCSCKNP